MSKQYAQCGEDVQRRIKRVRDQFHPQLKGVTIAALFVFGDEPKQVLEHQGYPAAAVIKKTGTKERAAGLADALLVIDRYVYEGLTDKQRDAMVDHELYHLDPVLDELDRVKLDSCGRPRLDMRPHDRQIGFFDEVASRHGEHSLEVMYARSIIQATAQLYFPFYERSKAA